MVKEIIKRDGILVPFDEEKITRAILKAAEAVTEEGELDYKRALDLTQEVVDRIQEDFVDEGEIATVEEVQDIVEKELIEAGHAKTAKAYILYRARRSEMREKHTGLMKVYGDLTLTEAEQMDLKRENANVDGNTAMGTMLQYGSEGAKQFNHMYMLSEEASKAHKSGDIHIHDLDFLALTMTCTQINLQHLFEGGFSTGHGFLREPNDIVSASALSCIAIQSSQNDMHGGQSVPALDYYLGKYVAKTYLKEIKDILDLVYGVDDYKALEGVFEASLEETRRIMNPEGTEKIKEVLRGYKLKENQINNLLKKAEQRTDKRTFQAMEAMIANLNTMHSRAGRECAVLVGNY